MKRTTDTEKTPLNTAEGTPQYLFQSSIARQRRQRVYQFQCCIGTVLLCIVLVVIVAVISYNLNDRQIEPSNDENPRAILQEQIDNDNNSNVTDRNVLLLTSIQYPIKDKERLDEEPVIKLNTKQWNEVIDYGKKSLQDLERFEKLQPLLNVDSPSYRHQRVMATTSRANILSKIGYAENQAAKYVSKNFRDKGGNSTTDLVKIKYENVSAILKYDDDICNKTHPSCDPNSTYRSYDGSCNNLHHPYTWGVGLTPFRRALPPNYSDGMGEPRRAKDGSVLPTARKVSLQVHRPYYRNDPKFTVMLAVWGQFLDHDITATALSHRMNGSAISCCGQEPMHPECYPVYLDEEDPNFWNYNITCMEFVRSAPAPTCSLGPRQQMNQISAYIDGSVVYGPDAKAARLLRKLDDGKLKVYRTDDKRDLLPMSEDPDDGCNREEESAAGKYCFATGDARANENLHLTTMHLLWVRQHNLIVNALKEMNKNWTDERLYQEGRRIVAAQMQHITYTEFLVVLLGPKLMKNLQLSPMDHDYFKGYDDQVDASIANDFAAAGFRFAHTLIPALMKFYDQDMSSPEYVQLHKMLFDPFKLYNPGELDRALRGAMHTHLEAADPYFNSELQQHLFQRDSSSKLCGLDLVSLNIQRGRDHGLAAYSLWRERCGLRVPRTFQDLGEVIDDDSLNRIRSIYKTVEDIDLYTGALSERPLTDGMLGPTITCIITDQFVRLKKGDRYWYENPGVFTPDQLQEIRRTSLARIICDTADDVTVVPQLTMQRSPLRNCSEVPRPNLAFWTE